ncbi:MAG: tail fiber domain-containing protein, partial [Ferruginibacter sp.]
YNITGFYNSVFGSFAAQNTTSSQNSVFGYNAANLNTSGYDNTVFGAYVLLNNRTGYSNAAFGKSAGYNSTGSNNSYFGNYAGVGSSTGSNNTYIGYFADASLTTFSNATAIGSFAKATASNMVMLGSNTITAVKAAGSFVIYSDGRFKKNVKENVPGLEFIKQLRPVTYNYDIRKLNDYTGPSKSRSANETRVIAIAEREEEAIVQKEKKVYTGFVAQEVEKIADNMGYDFSGVYKPQNETDPYGLSYADFVVPLVKAVQELSKSNEQKDALITGLQQQLNEITERLKKLEIKNNTFPGVTTITNSNPLSAMARLEQNAPNPYNSNTVIGYTLPSDAIHASMNICNASGQLLKIFPLIGKGPGNIIIRTGEFSAGAYSYTLIIDGKKIDSKQMVLIK